MSSSTLVRNLEAASFRAEAASTGGVLTGTATFLVSRVSSLHLAIVPDGIWPVRNGYGVNTCRFELSYTCVRSSTCFVPCYGGFYNEYVCNARIENVFSHVGLLQRFWTGTTDARPRESVDSRS